MPLSSISLLHVGDVHYPDTKNESTADQKDGGFPAGVSNVLKMNPLSCVARMLMTKLDEMKPKALLLTGDLTCRGDVAGYIECLTFLNGIFNFRRWRPKQVHVVPGNHDVDRNRIDPSGVDLMRKFEEFDTAWRNLGLPSLATDNLRESFIPLKRPSGVRIFSINSSLGCGEKRYLPPAIATKLADLLASYSAGIDPKEAFDLLGETLDTPAFASVRLDEFCQTTDGEDENCVPVLVTHHNLLPQARVRIAMYTEMLNAGTMRSRLTKLQRPILYCHGHIHDFPVEIITAPEYPGSLVISISAPAFSKGFNWITVEFSSQQIPLGCYVESYRLNDQDFEIRPFGYRIPFHHFTYDKLRRFANPIAPEMLAKMPETPVRTSDLARTLGLDLNESHDKDKLVECLLEAEWLGAIILTNKAEPEIYWTVEKVVR